MTRAAGERIIASMQAALYQMIVDRDFVVGEHAQQRLDRNIASLRADMEKTKLLFSLYR